VKDSISPERFVRDGGEPGYRRALRDGTLAGRVDAALRRLEDCHVCPRDCGGNRLFEAAGTCRTGRLAVVASAFPHFGEEDCLSGTRGSGTIFFSQCNLRCVFCQNWDISQVPAGRAVTGRQLASIMLALESRGCHNINLVTPSHVVPQVVEAIAEAARAGLGVPVVYNTGGYDTPASLRLLDGLVDIYMPDFKCWHAETGRRLMAAPDYAERAREAIAEMHRQVGVLEVDRHGLARRGVLLRHLVMPGQADEAAAIFQWVAREISPDTVVNVMGQYRPECRVGHPSETGGPLHADINRRPTRQEMASAFDAGRAAGLWRFA